MLIGILLVMGGLIVLSGGSGLAGVVERPGWRSSNRRMGRRHGHRDRGDRDLGRRDGVGAMRRQTRAPYTSASLFSGVWIVLGIFWIVIGSTPIPGVLTIAVNLVILLGARGAAVVSIGISWDPLTPNKARRRLKHLQRDEVDATIRLGLPARGGDGGSPWRNSCTPGPVEPPQVALRRSRSACAGRRGPWTLAADERPAHDGARLLPQRRVCPSLHGEMKEATAEMFEKLLVATDGLLFSDAAIYAAGWPRGKDRLRGGRSCTSTNTSSFLRNRACSPDLETPDEARAVVATAIEKLNLNGVVARGHLVQAPTREVARKVMEIRGRERR